MPAIITTFDSDARPFGWPAEGEMHFQLQDELLGFLTLDCNSGYVVATYDLGYPSPREVIFPNSLDDGTHDLTQYFGSRAVSLDVVLRPTQSINGSGIQFSGPRMRDSLVAYCHPARRPFLVFSEHGDDRVRQVALRGTSLSAPINNPRFNRMNVGWIAPLGVIESYQLHFATANLTEDASNVDLPTPNAGTTGSHWLITLTGEISKPVISLDGDPEHALELDYDAVFGDTIEIDSFNRTVKINDLPVGYRYLNDNSNWFTLPPGDHVVQVDHAGGDRVGWPYARWEGTGLGSSSFFPLVWLPLDGSLLNRGYGSFFLAGDTPDPTPEYLPIPDDPIISEPGHQGLTEPIYVASTSSMGMATNAESAVMLAYIPPGLTGQAGLYSNGDLGDGGGIYLDGLTLTAVRTKDGTPQSTLTHVLPADDTTYSIGVSVSGLAGGEHRLFVNGVMVDSEILGEAASNGDGEPIIGGYLGPLGGAEILTDEFGTPLTTSDGEPLMAFAVTPLASDIEGTGIIIAEFGWVNAEVDPDTILDYHNSYFSAYTPYSEEGPAEWADPPFEIPGETLPDPPPPPPWAWSTEIDPETGEPGTTQLTIQWRDTWI